jgi:phosphoribosyl-ATP pyrophosphohydrolase/phosphoribosyl-AMP cyclohydrolase
MDLKEKIKFDEKGLIPAVVQEHITGEVLMVAYMNKETLRKTIETGYTYFWSRSRNEVWKKGETSGNVQKVKDIRIDCDNDCLLINVEQTGVACHTGNHSCFYKEVKDEDIIKTNRLIPNKAAILEELFEVIFDRKINPKEGSYTNYLFEKGLDKILKKIGEEAAEVIIASKNKDKDEIRYEVSDLVYHLMVLLVESGLKPEDIYNELEKRR